MGFAKSVLIVEDDTDLAELIQMRLHDLEVQSKVAHDPATAIKRIGERKFGAIILDMTLGDASGMEVLVALEGSLNEATPVLIASGTLEEDGFQNVKHKAIDFMLKPFDVQSLAEKVRNLLK